MTTTGAETQELIAELTPVIAVRLPNTLNKGQLTNPEIIHPKTESTILTRTGGPRATAQINPGEEASSPSIDVIVKTPPTQITEAANQSRNNPYLTFMMRATLQWRLRGRRAIHALFL
jgi:hypothetical protein